MDSTDSLDEIASPKSPAELHISAGKKWEMWKEEKAQLESQKYLKEKEGRVKDFITTEGRQRDVRNLKSKFEAQASVPITPEVYYTKKMEEAKDVLQRVRLEGIGLHNYICQENLDLTTRCGKQKLMQAWVQSKAATSQEVVTVEDAIGFLEEIRLHRVDASSLDTATHSTTNGVTPGKIPQEKIEFFTKLQEQEWNEWASAAEEAIGRGRISRRNRSPENTSVWKIVEDPIPEPEPHARQSTNEREPTKLPFNQSNLKSASERVTSPSIAPFKPVKLKKQHVRSRSTESFPPPQRPIMYQEALGATSIDEEPEIIEDKNLVRDLIKLFDKDNEQRNPECNVECNACSVS